MLFFLIDKLFLVYTCMLFGRILGSWIPELQHTKLMQFVAFYTDPYLNLFRKIIPPLGMFDLSPIVAFLCLNFLEHLVKSVLISL
jgi:YggT family protein